MLKKKKVKKKKVKEALVNRLFLYSALNSAAIPVVEQKGENKEKYHIS